MQQAIPFLGGSLVRVVPPAALNASDQAQADARAQAEDKAKQPDMTGLASFIRAQFETFKLHRNNPTSGWTERLLAALRAFNGVYDANKLGQIRQFGGSEVYAKIIAMKCRGATSLLRDVYLSADRPWGLDASEDPKIPDSIMASISQLTAAEMQAMHQAGKPPDLNSIRDRTMQLVEAARDAARKKAREQAQIAEDKIDEMLVEGKFYDALAEFLVDLPLFPFACIKGPVVRIVPVVDWGDGSGRPNIVQKPRLFWQRVSPFDIWWTPGASDIDGANVIERSRVTRAELNELLDLPSYNQTEVRAVLDEYGSGGLNDNWDMSDAERAVQESRENPWVNRSGLISCLEFNGNVQGRMLLDYGIDQSMVQDPIRDYMVQGWMVGTHVIKVQMSPSPRKRHPYFVTSFEKVPGTPVGNGLPDILSDVQDVGNATLRSLVNNMSMASGPQVVVNDDRLAPDEDGEQMFPWKRWHVLSDPMGNNTQVPVSFFQPNSNANEMMQVYQWINSLADDLSAIPRYMNGQSPGAAGRTSSGLAMLMGNSSKILQTVAANVDRDVFSQLLQNLFDMLMLTDTSGLLTGEENVRVMGVQVALQKETERSRQLEFLSITANPLDQSIMGIKGRAAVLRPVSKTIGLDGEKIVPTDDELDQMQKAQQAQQANAASAAIQQSVEKGVQSGVQAGVQRISTELTAGVLAARSNMPEGPPAHIGTPPVTPAGNAAAQAQGSQPGPTSTGDAGPRTNLQQQRPNAFPQAGAPGSPVAGGAG
jgi:hypothetical protein